MSGRPRRVLIPNDLPTLTTPVRASRRSTLSENSDSVRRSPRLSEQRELAPKVVSKRIPTPPRAQRSRLLVAINETGKEEAVQAI